MTITDAQIKAALDAYRTGEAIDEFAEHKNMRAALEAAERAAWQPIETAPRDRVFLATTWESGDDWRRASIKRLSGPFSRFGNLYFLNHNSPNNYTRAERWMFWRPDFLEPGGDK